MVGGTGDSGVVGNQHDGARGGVWRDAHRPMHEGRSERIV